MGAALYVGKNVLIQFLQYANEKRLCAIVDVEVDSYTRS